MIRDYAKAKGEVTYSSLEVLQGTDLGGVINELDVGANVKAGYNVTVLSNTALLPRPSRRRGARRTRAETRISS